MMSPTIFGTQASRFWAKGLPVVPVQGKAPLVTGWTGLLGSLPSDAKRAELIENYGNNGIGMLTGYEFATGWILVALDVDDDKLWRVVLGFLGLNRSDNRAVLSGKRGKRGGTVFARARKSLKSTVIKGANGLGNIDVLGAGKMTVMPPSIHPETGLPYVTLGTDLLEADLAELPEVTLNIIELTRATIGSGHAEALISGDSTHDAGVALAAALVQSGATDEEIIAIFEGLLPEGYTGNSLAELSEWISSARKKGFDEQKGEGGGSLTQALVTLALASEMDLFNDGDGTAYATLPHLGKGVAVRVESSSFALWFRHLAHTEMGRSVSTGPLKEAATTL